MNIFEKATKDKIMFDYKGTINCYDLWELSVTELDSIYKVLNAQRKQVTEDSLLEVKTAEDTILTTKISIITHIVETKQKELYLRKSASERKEKKEKIMSIIASKEDDALEKKSPSALKKMLDEL